MDRPIPDSYWVVDGMLFAGEYPGSRDRADARRKLESFLDAGIRAFFDLTEDGELSPYDGELDTVAGQQGLNVTYDRVPIRDLGVPSAADLQALLIRLAINLASATPSYVHCWGGIGRTGTVIGCWMVEHEAIDADRALKRIADPRRGTPDGHRRSPETGEQAAVIREWLDVSRKLLGERLDGLARLLPTLRAQSVSSESASTVSDIANKFSAAVYEYRWCVPFDWNAWTSEAERFVDDRGRVAAATVIDLTRLLTFHVRQERFCDGHLDAMASSGHLRAILERMAVIRDSLGDGRRTSV